MRYSKLKLRQELQIIKHNINSCYTFSSLIPNYSKNIKKDRESESKQEWIIMVFIYLYAYSMILPFCENSM